jgi:hypothetical protein
MQRTEFVLIRVHERLLRLTRLSEDCLGLVIDEGIQLGIEALDAVKMSPCHFDRGNFFAVDLGGDFAGGKLRD